MLTMFRRLMEASGDGGGAGGGGGGNANATPWYGEIPADRAELREWVENKGYKDPLAALESAWNLEKLAGAPPDQIIRLPKPDDAQGWEGVWNRLGRPEKPEDYELPVPEGDDGEFAKLASQWFHAAGVPKRAAQKIAEMVNQHVASQLQARRAELEQEAERQLDALKQEWGTEWDKRREFARRGFATYGKQAGLDEGDLAALEAAIGTAKMLKLFVALGETTGEHEFGAGGEGGGSGGLTPQQAKQKLDELRMQRLEGRVSLDDYMREAERLAPIAAKAA